MSDIRGRFMWYELLTRDPGSAIDFYADVVGWGTQEWEGGESPYTMWTANEAPVGGVMELPREAVDAGAPPHWLAYIGTPDVDATLARANELGASPIWGPLDVPTVGRMAGVCDPQGAVFAVYTPATPPAEDETPPSQGRFSWHELATTDWEAAWGFYSELFGWVKTDAMDMGEGNMYQMYGRGSFPLGGMYNKPPEVPGPAAWMLYAMVPDVNAAVEAVREEGGQVLNGPMEVPGGDLVAQCMDPQGAAFAVHAAAGGGS